MNLTFPTPTVAGEIYVAENSVTYQWDGSKWTTQIRPSYANTGSNPGPNPPVAPTPGTFWFDTVSGQLFTFFNDGTSEQWVETSTVHGTLYSPQSK